MDIREIINFLSNRRKQLGLSQNDIANKIGYSSQLIFNWEKGKSLPDLSILAPLCVALQISIDDLFNCESSSTNNKEIKQFNINAFSSSLKTLRNKHKYTQKDFADKIGVSYPTVIAWEKGKSTPSLRDFITICKLYGLNYSKLYFGEFEPLPSKKKKKGPIILISSLLAIAATLTAVPIILLLNINNKNVNSKPQQPLPYIPPIQRTITFLSDDRETILHQLTFDDNEHITSIGYIPLKEADSKIYVFRGWDLDDDNSPDNIDLYMTQDYTLVAIFEGLDRVESDIEYLVEEKTAGEVYLASCLSTKLPEEIILPNYIGTSKVTGIKSNLFGSTNSTIKKIIIPEGIVQFEASAFSKLKTLEEIAFPPSVNTIGTGIFYDDEALTKVTMPIKCDKVASNTFSGCTSLKYINISCCTELNSSMFKNCTSLETIEGLENIDLIYGNFATNSAIKYLKFTKNNITILDGAFNNLQELITLEILGTISYLGDNNFSKCNNLTTIVYPKTILSWSLTNELVSEMNFNIYYLGNEFDFAIIPFSGVYKYGSVKNKNIYFYSETPAYQCWRYVENIPTKYE